jgi:molybdopterin molybdotransferase
MDLPPFDNSAMDGYAVRMADLTGSRPWTLELVGRIAAGDDAGGELAKPGSAVRIFTGASVPRGFDAVVMQENCTRNGEFVALEKRPRMGENIRRAGEDVRSESALLEPGMLLTPQRLALLAAQGLAEIETVRRVRIGLLSTGSELREPGEQLGPGQIYNSNRIMIRSILASEPWAQVIDYGIVPDRHAALAQTLGEAAMRCDVVVTSGGVSAGDEDHILGALAEHGVELDVLKVAMRPGKPVKIGLMDNVLFAGLPGNPNAALVTFHQIALPAIRATAGIAIAPSHWLPGVAGFTYSKRLGRTEFVPVRTTRRDDLGRPVLEMLGRGSSASLMALALADGIAVLPPDIETIQPGLPLRYEPFGCC